MIERFADEENGGFFETSDDHERLVARRKDLEDNPIPSGNSSAAYGLLRLARAHRRARVRAARRSALRLLHEIAAQHPQAFAHLLQALDFQLAPVQGGGAGGRRTRAARARAAVALPAPPRARRAASPTACPLLEGRTPVDGRAAAYVCERFACKAPVTEPEELARLLS